MKDLKEFENSFTEIYSYIWIYTDTEKVLENIPIKTRNHKHSRRTLKFIVRVKNNKLELKFKDFVKLITFKNNRLKIHI